MKSGTSDLSRLNKDHLPGGAFRLAALLLLLICPIFSVVAPCQPGAALRNLVLLQPRQTTRRTWHVAWSAIAIATAVLALPPSRVPVSAQSFVSGSTGADGPLNPTCTNCTVTLDLPPNGVFNYTTINIPTSVTVVYRRNAANTPAIILASGDVTIAGAIDVNADAAVGGIPGRGGPGGFDGGLGGAGFGSSPEGTPGSGPGGGKGGVAGVGTAVGSASGGGFGSAGTGNGTAVPGGQAYGVQTLFPLIGGSGGGGGAGGPSSSGPAGGGGGGAIVLASSGTITMNVSLVSRGIFARGGNGVSKNTGLTAANQVSGGGSGGGIRIVANTIVTNGALLDVRGGSGLSGGPGRIRVEAFSLQGGFNTASVTTFSQGLPGPVRPLANSPSVRIVSIGGVNVPASPTASYFVPPDIILNPAAANPIAVALQASNVPLGTVISVSVITEGVAARSSFNSTPLAGTLPSSSATANVTLPPGTSILTATATFAQ